MRWTLFVVAIGVEAATIVVWQLSGTDHVPTSAVRDSSLRQSGVELFPARTGAGRARALIVFLGDTSCWRPYRRLASALANDGYAVVAVQPRRGQPTARASEPLSTRFVEDSLPALIRRSIAEAVPAQATPTNTMSRTTQLPVILMGHAEGATLALWASQHLAIDALHGVISLSASSATARDPHLNTSQAASLATSQLSAHPKRTTGTVAPPIRVASITGTLGPAGLISSARRTSDTETAFAVPFSTVRLTSPLLTGIVVRRSLNWILARK